MNQELFRSQYDRLNDVQKQAVDAIYGPVMVIAGPGSGKTQLLSLRIANILQKADVRPESILCLTFTHSAADTMRERLMRMIGPAAYGVQIHTFHSFGAELLARIRGSLRSSGIDSEELVDSEVVSDLRIAALLDELLSQISTSHALYGILNPVADDRSVVIRRLKGDFGDLKKAHIDADTLGSLVEDMSFGIDAIRGISEQFVLQVEGYGARSASDKEARFSLFQAYLQSSLEILQPLPKSVLGHTSFASHWGAILSGVVQDMIAGDKLVMGPLSDFIKKYLCDKNGGVFPWDREKEKALEALSLYRAYGHMMSERGYRDFDDLLLQAYREIRTNAFLQQELSERYEFILIDEFQDTNDLQLDLATSFLANVPSPNILVVGDDDQAIYKFQGASSANFEKFLQKFGDAQLFLLEYNYRSLEQIITHSRELMNECLSPISNILGDQGKQFYSFRSVENGEDGGQVSYLTFDNPLDQAVYVVDAVKMHVDNGGFYSDIALLSRKNRTLQEYLSVLSEYNIPVETTADEYISHNEAVLLLVDLLSVLCGLAGHTSVDEARSSLVRVMTSSLWGEDRSGIWSILSDKSLHFAHPRELLLQISARESSGTSCMQCARFLLDLSSRSSDMRLDDILDVLTGAAPMVEPYHHGEQLEIGALHGMVSSARTSPYYQRVVLDHMIHAPTLANDRLSNIDVFLTALKNFSREEESYSLTSVALYLDLGRKYGWGAKASKLFLGANDSVALSTIHKAKGKEYKYVFLLDTTHDQYRDRASAQILPKYILPPKEPQDLDDERRLIYTAFTRAEDRLFVLSVDKGLNEKGKKPPESLSGHHWHHMPPSSDTSRARVYPLIRRSSEYLLWSASDDEKLFLRSRLDGISMNATLFSAFLNIPETGVDEFISRYILRLPSAQNEQQIYGTAFHSGLEAFVQNHTKSGSYDDTVFFKAASDHLAKSDLLPARRAYYESEFQSYFPRVRDKIVTTQRDESFVEYSFGMVSGSERIMLGNIPLKGKMDRIDTTHNGSLIVHDYKSSKLSKISLSYEVQLRFYSVILSLSARFASFPSKSFVLDALHPSSGDTLNEYSLFPQKAEIERDKKLVTYVYDRIMNLDFSLPEGIETSREWHDFILRELGYDEQK